jgi:hypothetical protein
MAAGVEGQVKRRPVTILLVSLEGFSVNTAPGSEGLATAAPRRPMYLLPRLAMRMAANVHCLPCRA